MVDYKSMIKDLRLIFFLGSTFLVVISCVLESVIGFDVIFITPPLLFFWVPVIFKSQKLIKKWKEEIEKNDKRRIVKTKI